MVSIFQWVGAMNLKEIIYFNLLSLLKNISFEGEHSEEFYEGIEDEQRENLFTELSESIGNSITEIEASRDSNELHNDFDRLVTILKDFQESFDNYPSHRINEILIIIQLIQLFSESEEALADDFDINKEINAETFQLHEVEKYINQSFYLHLNDCSENSFLLFNPGQIEGFKNYLESKIIPPEFICSLLAQIGNEDSPLDKTRYVLFKKGVDNKATIHNYICFQIVREGKIFHKEYKYLDPPNLSSHQTSKPENKYQQFNDTLLILSEYNAEINLLDKYLRLYQVIENFMVRLPIVYLERKHNGKMFTIREFKRLYQGVIENEHKMLKNMLTDVLKLDNGDGDSFETYLTNEWNSLKNEFQDQDVTNINNLLEIAGFSNNVDFEDFKNQLGIKFSKLVYFFRNAIVHNKETEFHITHNELMNHDVINDTVKIVLEKFMIPILERIIFQLLNEENSIVWYNNSTLKLYEDE